MRRGESIVHHFLDMWNLIDIINIGTLYLMTGLALYDRQYKMKSYFWAISTICSFIIWTKLLYFFRWYKSFNWMIDMVITTFKSGAMWAFVAILIVLIGLFASAFNTHSNYIRSNWSEEACKIRIPPCEAKETKITSYALALKHSYFIALGEFDLDGYDNWGWLLFIMATVINCIIMLNLLISIFSKVHDDF